MSGDSDKKMRTRIFNELVKEQNADPTQMSAVQWLDLYAELNRRVAAERKERMYTDPFTADNGYGRRTLSDSDRLRRDALLQNLRIRELPPDFVNPYLSPREGGAPSPAVGVYFHYVPDALDYCMSVIGKVDLLLISAVTGKTPVECIDALKGRIYQDPALWEECFYRGFVPAADYVTGNLAPKLALAKRANEYYDGWFSENVVALEQAMPSNSEENFYVALGSPFVPAWMIDQFICYLLGGRLYSREEPDYIPVELRTIYDSASASWYIPEKGRYRHSSRSVRVWGTRRMEALHILEKTLNGKTPQVFDDTPKGRAINRSETLLACEKQKAMQNAFASWVFEDEHRAEILKTTYQERFCKIFPRNYDGKQLTFPTLSKKVNLYPYQRAAVERMLSCPTVLLAHDVGAGKTYEMIAAAVEMRRMGLAKKPAFVVPNHIVEQWYLIFSEMLPKAKLFIIEPKNYTPKKRIETLLRARDGDFDGILIAYSCFEQMPLSVRATRDRLLEQVKKLTDQIRRFPKTSTRAKSRQRKLQEELLATDRRLTEEIRDIEEGKTILPGFDELGIDALFVDEAHHFKNYPIDTKCDGLLGMNRQGSAKCVDLMEKVHWLRSKGRRVIFATGTPITNSVSDVWIMQSYLQSEELEQMGLTHFDAWVGMFAEKNADFEIDVTTRSYRIATRFSVFHNLSQLSAMLSLIADFHSVESADDLPICSGYTDEYLETSPALAEYLRGLSDRADRIRNGDVSRSEDNLLKITVDGRKAALDLRLVNPLAEFDPACKAVRLAKNAAEIWKSGREERLTQLIFCDGSVPKSGFNLYAETKRLLVENGVSEDEIAFVHDYDGDKRRELLFDAVNRGEIRILMGSTLKLGVGVNVQERLIAVHHLDMPWRPADLVQREGRILRRGNRNREVQIFRYIAKGSFDAYTWQLLEIKQKFISALLSGNIQSRDSEDIDAVVLDFAEIKALALGNPLLRKRAETANEIYRLQALQMKWLENRSQNEKRIKQLPDSIADLRTRIGLVVHDIAAVNESGAKKQIEKIDGNALGETVLAALSVWAGENQERELCMYRGFRIFLPAGMKKEKPFLWLVGNERYYVEVGESPRGLLRRLDHRLSTLTEVLISYNSRLEAEEEELEELRKLLEEADPYRQRLLLLGERLQLIDRHLASGTKRMPSNGSR